MSENKDLSREIRIRDIMITDPKHIWSVYGHEATADRVCATHLKKRWWTMREWSLRKMKKKRHQMHLKGVDYNKGLINALAPEGSVYRRPELFRIKMRALHKKLQELDDRISVLERKIFDYE